MKNLKEYQTYLIREVFLYSSPFFFFNQQKQLRLENRKMQLVFQASEGSFTS